MAYFGTKKTMLIGLKGEKGDGAGINNQNLLINPDFSINQRGQTSYSGNNIYTVDRWKTSALSSVARQTDGKWTFGISGITSAASRTCIYQDIEDFEKLKGKTVTASIKVNNITEDISSTVVLYINDEVSNKEVLITGPGTFIVTKVVNANATRLRVGISGKKSATNYTITPEWIKLEIGSVATAFVPPLIAEELPKCQRYYQTCRINGVSFCATNTNIIYTAIPLTVSMRPSLTLTNITQSSIRVFGEGIKGTANVTFNILRDNVCQISVDTSTFNMTQYSGGVLVNGDITLDAEIY